MVKLSGIYKIQSIIKPERFYIGSAVYVYNRWSTHRNELNSNTHHCKKLQRHFNKYGITDLQFSILEVCVKESLLEREQKYIDELNPYFNECKIAGNRSGQKASSETKLKMSNFRRGKKLKPISEEGRKNMSLAHLGYQKSDEVKKKHSTSMIGKNKGKPSWNKGKHQSQEWKERIGIANKKRWAERKLKNVS